jgi:hypothetical protein
VTLCWATQSLNEQAASTHPSRHNCTQNVRHRFHILPSSVGYAAHDHPTPRGFTAQEGFESASFNL